MTRRERLEARAERRREWADKAAARSAAKFDAVHRIADSIPLGQPILVGHHSERHARKDQERIHNGMAKGIEEQEKAKAHVSAAGGIEDQLERSIFSDDPGAVEAIEARIREREAAMARHTAVNKAYKKAPGADAAAKLAEMMTAKTLTQAEAMEIARNMGAQPWNAQPWPPYVNANLSGGNSKDRERIKAIEARAAHTREIEAAGGFLVKRTDGYAVVGFDDYPGRDIVTQLKAAGFHWSGGRWHGREENIPAKVLEMEKEGKNVR